MAWIRVESSVARNRKFVKAGPGPSWLWLCGLAYCQEGLTDGFIPVEAIDYLGVRSARQLARHLVSAGLWDVVEGGWQVHDYLEHNRSASDVEAIRQLRAMGGKQGGRPKRNLPDNLKVSDPETSAEKPQNPSSATATSTATETASVSVASQPATARPQPIIARRRLDAAYEHESGLYVPNRAHQDLLPMHGGREQELLDWYPAVCAAWAGRQTGTDMIRFWKARHDETWPPEHVTATKKPWAPLRVTS